MSLVDCRGVAVSTSDPDSLALYEKAVELSLGYFVDPFATVQSALDADPDFAMGHCLRAGMIVMSSDRMLVPLLAESVEAVERLGKRANARERAHAAAARAWLHGDFAGSIRKYGEIAMNEPRDVFALQVAHIGDFLLGASSMLRDRVAQVLPEWDANTPGYGFVLGMHAFGLEENGLYPRAEDTGRLALEKNRRDPWAVHAVAHVMEMQGRLREGIEWLESRRDDWAPDNGFAFHNWWHLALFYLDLGEHQRVLELYDERVRPQPTQIPLEMVDASALLWRLNLRGVNVGARWEALADSWKPFADHGYYAFNDVHACMAFASAGRTSELQTALSTLEQRAQGQDTNAMMSRDVGLPCAQALVACTRGDYQRAVDLLLPIRTIANRFGGSHAQRDLIHLTLTECALKSGQVKLARALANERVQLKPSSPFNWLLKARALEGAGDQDGARKLRDHAENRRHMQFVNQRAVA
ncbi:MAG: tetratricopeptide repeat protein [Steroidobacteraceae bacterium]